MNTEFKLIFSKRNEKLTINSEFYFFLLVVDAFFNRKNAVMDGVGKEDSEIYN